jgi:hypothetical protein
LADDSTLRSARGAYAISVASGLSGLDPQTLRLYERSGLLTPARTQGGTRRYSDDDLRLGRITQLVIEASIWPGWRASWISKPATASLSRTTPAWNAGVEARQVVCVRPAAARGRVSGPEIGHGVA